MPFPSSMHACMLSHFCRVQLFNPVDHSPPGSSVHGIFQSRKSMLLLLSRFSCVRLFASIDGSPPGSSVPGILQARVLEWVAISFSNVCMHTKLLQSCLTLCYPIDGSPPGSPVPGILQARTLEWVAISFSKTECDKRAQ